MTLGAEIRTESDARATLKLAPHDPPSTWRAAFQREVKASHPDQGGDSERVRRVIEAYRFLKTKALAPEQPAPRPQARPEPRAARPPPPPQPEARPEPPPEPARQRPEPPMRI